MKHKRELFTVSLWENDIIGGKLIGTRVICRVVNETGAISLKKEFRLAPDKWTTDSDVKAIIENTFQFLEGSIIEKEKQCPAAHHI